MKPSTFELAFAIAYYNAKVRECEAARLLNDLTRYRWKVEETELALAEANRLIEASKGYPRLISPTLSPLIHPRSPK